MGYKKLFLFLCAILSFICYGAEIEDGKNLRIAFEAHKRGLYGLSNSRLETHIRQNPGSPGLDYAYLLYSANYIQLQEYDSAIEKLEFLKQNYSESPFLKDGLAYLALAYLKTGNMESSVSAYREYKKKFGENEFVEKQVEEALIKTAVTLFNGDRLNESRRLFNLFTKEFPASSRFPLALYYTGILFYRENNFVKAGEFLRKAMQGAGSIENEAIVADLYLKLGDSLFNQNDYREASGFYGKVIKDFPSTPYHAWASFQLAAIERKRDNFDRAEELLEGIKGGGDSDLNFRILFELANIKMLREDWQSAGKQLAEIVELFPGHQGLDEIYLQAGFVNFNMKKFEEAIKFFRKAASAASGRSIRERSYFGLGYSYYAVGDTAESFKAWDKLVKEFPESAFIREVLFLKGKKLYENEDYPAAEKVLSGFIEKFPGSSLYRSALIMAIESLQEQGKLEKARKLCEGFLEKEEEEFISFLYGRILYLSKDFEKAKSVFDNLRSENPAVLVETAYYSAKIYEYRGNKEKAQEKFLEIISFFPNFPKWVQKAEEEIKNLSK